MNQDLNHPSAGLTDAFAGEASADGIADTATAANANANETNQNNASSPVDVDNSCIEKNAKSKADKPKKPLGTPISPHFRSIAQMLTSTVDFFREHTDLKDLDHMYYTQIPIHQDGGIDWGNSNSITEAFPVLKGRGKLVIPMALMFEADDLDGKLVVINYWRLLKADEQRKVRDDMRKFYLRPSISNERINLHVAKRIVQAKDSAVSPVKARTTGNTMIIASNPKGLQGTALAELPAFSQAREELSNRVRFFTEVAPLQGITMVHYSAVPPNMNWNDVEAIQNTFPPLTTCTKRQVPLCMILETQSDEERLIIVNWWRYLDSIQQSRILQELRRYYRAPMKSKDAMPDLHVVRDKRKERQLAPTWGFRCIETCQQLADKLNLTTDMIQTANIESGASCMTEGCIYPALSNNGGFCCRHRNAFAPMKGKERLKRGHLLLGPAYTRPNNRLCSCNNETCVGIGFADTMLRFDVSRLSDELQAEIWEDVMPRSRKTAALAPWHFHPQHRVFLPDGSWKIVEYRRGMIFRDPVSGKDWPGVPPPTYSPIDFLEEPEMIEYKLRKETTLLPAWVREYQRLEEGPVSIHEQQTNQLYKRIAQLEEKLNSQALDFETSYHALEKDILELQDKHGDKKQSKRKRKRICSDSNGIKKRRSETAEQSGDNDNGTDENNEFHNEGISMQNQVDAAIRQNPSQAQYAENETFAPYYEERVRNTGALSCGNGSARRY